MTTGPPLPGQDPWGDDLNNYLKGLEAQIAAGGGGGGGTQGPPGPMGPQGPQGIPGPPGTGGGGSGSSDPTTDGSWYAGKHWYAMGTSLTIQGFYTAPLAAMSGMILHNIGQSAQSLSQTPTGGSGAMWSALVGQTGTDAEVITMETTNDWRLSATLGTINDAENYQTSFYGALKAACAWIFTNRPAARFFLMTNYNDAFPGGTFGNFKTPNNQGKYQWEFDEAIRKVALMYGVPIIEMTAAGLNYYVSQYFTSDGLHLNTLGGTRFAEHAWNVMKPLGWLTSRPTPPAGAVVISVTGVSIDQGDAIALAPGDTRQLSATIAPSNASNKGQNWTSGTTAVATVSGLGFVTAVGGGTSVITVTTADGAKTDTITVTVAVAAVTGVDVQPPTVTIIPAMTQQLTASVFPTNAGNKTVTWQSSAPSKATVNSTGLVTGVALGNATITATTQDGSFIDTCVVTIASSIPVTGVDIVQPSGSAGIGSTFQLTANVLPANATNKNVTWASSNPAKATVSSTGLVTGVATGTCNITATTQQGGFVDTCAFSVSGQDWSLRKANVYTGCGLTGLSVDANNDPKYTVAWPYGAIILNDITAGDNAVEFAVATDSGPGAWAVIGTDGSGTKFGTVGALGTAPASLMATPTSAGLGTTTGIGGYLTVNDTTGAWASPDRYRMARSSTHFYLWKWNTSTSSWTKHLEFPIASVFQGNSGPIQSPGIGILVAAGQAKVTDVYTGVYQPTTYIPVNGIDVLPPTKSLTVGTTFFVTVDYTPDTATEKSMTWVSSNPAVATVSVGGKVTGVAPGTTTITGTSVDGGLTDTCIVTVPSEASEWSLSPQTSFREFGLTGLTASGSDPTYTSNDLPYSAILINTPGHNAVEFAVKSGAKGGGLVLGSNGSTDWISIGNTGTPLTSFNAKAVFSNGVYSDGAPPPVTPTQFAEVVWATGSTYRIGRSGNRVKIVRVDPGNTLVTLWDGDLPTNYVSREAWFGTIDLGVLAYQAPESIYTLPINCKTGTWTP